jgi:RNA polymerase sigma-70 factor, ECF subfamily
MTSLRLQMFRPPLEARPPAPGNTIPAPSARLAPGPPRTGVNHDASTPRFQSLILSNLDAAHNLAWWLTRDEHEAADIVQESCLKAWRFFPDFRGGDAKSWLLSIVRTTAISRKRQRRDITMGDDAPEIAGTIHAHTADPLAPLLQAADRQLVSDTIASLPDSFRELLVLREMEGLSYAQIAIVLAIPVGTVMSRLSRARDAARDRLRAKLAKE